MKISLGSCLYGYLEYAPSGLEGFSVRADATLSGRVTSENDWTSSALNDQYGITGTRANTSAGSQYHLFMTMLISRTTSRFWQVWSIIHLSAISYLRGANVVGAFQS